MEYREIYRGVATTGILFLLALAAPVFGQGTSFTYQGRLTDGGTPANGNYDFHFDLYDTPDVGTGTRIGQTQNLFSVPVSDGIFTVTLDFGAQAFLNSDRYLQIVVQRTGDPPPPTLLSPRQKLTSTPYAIRSISAITADAATNATQLAGVDASQYVVTGDARLSDARPPTAGSANYIQNSTTPQAASSFNITGTGQANNFDANQYSLNGARILSNAGTSNLFAGEGAGQANNLGNRNAFFGYNSGMANTIGEFNSFFGNSAGQNNKDGRSNDFFGDSAGIFNSNGSNNSIFGSQAGTQNSTGSFNTFVGNYAGQSNTTGNNNTALGYLSNVVSPNLTNATAIGANARVDKSNSLILGSINGVNFATADTNVGIGTTTPAKRLHVVGDGVFEGNLDVTGTINGTFNGTIQTANNALSLGGVTASQYVQTGDARLSDARPPTAGSANYIQNGTAPQAGSSFNVSGDGTIGGNLNVGGSLSLNTVNANTQYNLAGSRVLSGDRTSNNFFAGFGAGNSITTGSKNAFFGPLAGVLNSSGQQNSFFGSEAGNQNSSGAGNSFFGAQAGKQNTIGVRNSFFGGNAGLNNTSGGDNTYFGVNAGAGPVNGPGGSFNAMFGNNAGLNNTTSFNSFFGYGAGQATTTGDSNAFFGQNTGNLNDKGKQNAFFGTQAGAFTNADFNTFMGTIAGSNNQTGSSNTAVGYNANMQTAGLQNATAIGARAIVAASDSLVLGSINGVNGATADTKVGIGTTAPTSKLHVVGDGLFTGNLTVNGTLNANIASGNANYIQNTTTQQATSNFNISGNGTAGGILSGNVVNAATQFNIGGARVFSSDQNANLFAGFDAGGVDPIPNPGTQNTFIGLQAGSFNAGNRNVFIGFQAGQVNTIGTSNTAIGRRADFGANNLDHATAIGAETIVSASNTIALGRAAGQDTVQIPGNSIVGGNVGVGIANPTAKLHVAGDGLFTGNLTVNGTFSGNLPTGSPNYIQNSATQQTNTSFNISGNGIFGGSVAVGGDFPPDFKLHVLDFGNTGLRVQTNTGGGTVASFGPNGAFQIDKGVGNPGGRFTVLENGNVGIDNAAPTEKLDVNGNIKFSGTLNGDGSGLSNVVAATAVSAETTRNLTLLGSLRWDLLMAGSTFAVGASPSAIAFDGANIWVTNSQDNSVTKLRATDGAPLGTFAVGHSPQGIAFDGANIWVTNHQSNTVTKLRASDGASQGTFAVGSNPQGAAFDGANIWVANQPDNTVTKLRASDGTNLGTFAAGIQPVAIAFDGNFLYITPFNPSEALGVVKKMRPSDGSLLPNLPAISSPDGIAFDGSSIWVANFSSNNVSRVRAVDGSNGLAIDVGNGPKGVAFDGTNIWVANSLSNTVTKLRGSDGTLLVTFGVGVNPTGIAFDGKNIWVANSGSNTVTRLPAFPF